MGGMPLWLSGSPRTSVLRDDVTAEQAGDVLWVLCGSETFDALYTSRGKSLDGAIEVIAWTAEQVLCRPPDRHAALTSQFC